MHTDEVWYTVDPLIAKFGALLLPMKYMSASTLTSSLEQPAVKSVVSSRRDLSSGCYTRALPLSLPAHPPCCGAEFQASQLSVVLLGFPPSNLDTILHIAFQAS